MLSIVPGRSRQSSATPGVNEMNLMDGIKREKIIVVLRAPSVDEGIERAEKVISLGLKLIEVTFTVPNADRVLKELSEKHQDIVFGAGTVLSPDECERAISSGAKFVVSPHLDEEISECASEKSVPYFPGVMTPTEVVKALKMGRDILKLFPSSTLGVKYMKALSGPFPNVRFIPTGGVNPENFCDWIRAGSVAVGVGSFIFKGDIEENVKALLRAREECERG